MTLSNQQQPLAGLTVLDMSHVYAAPYATLLLALAGARVIKIEPPSGEHLRKRGTVPGPRYAFAMLNSNKESMTLDLKHADGPDLLKRLVRRADVLVENFRPGVLDRLGVGWPVLREVNPRLIYAHSSGYGSTGPYAKFPAMDLSVQAMSGIVAATGQPDADPVKAGVAICDFSAGIHLYGALMTALYQRERTGRGSRVEVSMMESVFPMLMSSLSTYYASGQEPPRAGNRHPGLSVAPYTVYQAKDGYIAIICEGDHHWMALAAVMGRPELQTDERFATMKARVAHMAEVDAMVGEWVAARLKEDVFALLLEAGVPAAPVRRLPEAADDPHLRARGFLRQVEHPELGEITALGTPLVVDGTPEVEVTPSRQLGQDTEHLMSDFLDLSAEEYRQLRDGGVFGAAAA